MGGPNYRIGPNCARRHSCNNWFNPFLVISLVLRGNDTFSENVSLIWRSVSDSQKTQFKECIIDRYINKDPDRRRHMLLTRV